MKTILVTGATRGIGRAITEKLLAEGHKVYGVYKESAEQAKELAEKYGDTITHFDEWNETLTVNLTAPLKLVHGLRTNLNDGSSVVNIASVDGYVSAFDTIAYAASKAALINLTKSLAAVLGPRNIRVNAVAPGWVETEMTADTMPDESKELTPLKRNAQPQEVA